MNPIKQLAGQTAIYGLSSIVARIINFFFVPLYTRMLSTGNYGLASELLAYIALLQVVLTFGMETGFFRFASKDKSRAEVIFSTALISLGSTSISFLLLITLFAGPISLFAEHPANYIIYSALILAIDCFTAILFAELRFKNKAFKFALFRTIKILSEVSFNLILFLYLPKYFIMHPDSVLLKFIPATPDYGYILMAILLSCMVSLVLFVPRLLNLHFIFSKQQFRELIIYSLPLMIAGLPGVANDFISRIFFRFFAPATSPWQDQLGIFNANVKLAVFMVLFVQMFRYAAEPFFFSSSARDDMKKIYADVMKYFVAFCVLIFLCIAMYPELFALLLGKEFRIGIGVLPIMLIANILLGIVFNLSMWYKLSGKTRYALTITMLGLGINLLINIVFMPVYGYLAAAWGYLFSYLAMVIFSYYLSRKYYPIPYEWKTILLYLLTGVAIYLVSVFIAPSSLWIRILLNTLYIIIFVGFVLKREKIDLRKITVQLKRI
ncbi:MAG: oligosaccharide flippase family protein [Bacteroidota bacterium]